MAGANGRFAYGPCGLGIFSAFWPKSAIKHSLIAGFPNYGSVPRRSE